MKAADLFAGFGGWTEGAQQAGAQVVWTANHNPQAVEWHQINHPGITHACQDLHQTDWSDVPAHDLLLSSPCCQGHSPARGKDNGKPQYDASRSTAWAVVSAAEYHRPPVALVENVPAFIKWPLYPAWQAAMQALGYSIQPHIVDAADHDTPQNRPRLFLVCTRSSTPLTLNLEKRPHIPATRFIAWQAGKWSPIETKRRATSTLQRVANGRRDHGERFLMPYYGSGSGTKGRSLNRPVGTITTRDRWAVVDGDRMRMLTRDECRQAMGFPDHYKLPDDHHLAVHLLGNAVCPPVARDLIEAVRRAA